MWGQRQQIRHETLVSYTGLLILSGNYRSAFRAASLPQGWRSSEPDNVNALHRPIWSGNLQASHKIMTPVARNSSDRTEENYDEPCESQLMVCITLENRTYRREVRSAKI
jgi:hypothetical protein